MSTYSASAVRGLLLPLARECAQLGLDPERRRDFAGATPLYDSRRDDLVRRLAAFEPARAALSQIDRVKDQYGDDAADRLVLKFAFEVIAEGAETAIDSTIERLCRELETPTWRWIGLANLRNYEGGAAPATLDTGVTIRPRDSRVLAEDLRLPYAFGVLADEWRRGGPFGSHMLVVESELPKKPENVLRSAADILPRACRALLAMRLAAPGDVAIGRLSYHRAAHFEFALGGVSSTLNALEPTLGIGTAYVMNDGTLAEVRRAAAMIAAFEVLPEKSRRKLARALDYFSSIYNRAPAARDRFVDSISALEAVFGSDSESTFKLAFRVASLMADGDAARSKLFDFLRDAYDARSKVVHGDEVKAKHQVTLAREEELRQMTRKILVGCLRLAPVKSVEELLVGLDARLLSSAERETLRSDLWPR